MNKEIDELLKGLEEDVDYRVFDSSKLAAQWLFGQSEDDLQYFFHTVSQMTVTPKDLEKEVPLIEYILTQMDNVYTLEDGRVLFKYADKEQ